MQCNIFVALHQGMSLNDMTRIRRWVTFFRRTESLAHANQPPFIDHMVCMSGLSESPSKPNLAFAGSQAGGDCFHRLAMILPFSKSKGLLIYLGRRWGVLMPKRSKKAYPNSDRFGEDGRRLYSAYDAGKAARAAKAAKFAKAIETAAKGKKPVNRVKQRRRALLIGGGSLAAVVGLLMYLIGAG